MAATFTWQSVTYFKKHKKIEIKAKILMSNIHKRTRFVNSDDPLVPMVQLILIEDDVTPMVLFVQNEF